MEKPDARDRRIAVAVIHLRDFMEENLAASKVELEAKLIDSHLGQVPFEPAHLHHACRILLDAGFMTLEHTKTRGGGSPPIYVISDRVNRARKVEDATSRKRLLMSRYYSYVQGAGGASSSLAGPAGEAAFHTALTNANVGASLAVVTKGRPSVPTIMNEPVPVGPLDHAFVLQPIDPTTHSPQGPWGVQVLVEVKNIREWIYPRTQELYQVLLKSALLQASYPSNNFLPLLVCRKAHTTARFMAKDLGFFIIDSKRQYLPDSSLIDPKALEEIRMELGLSDLVQGTNSTRDTENRLITLQRHYDVETALSNWQTFCADPSFVPMLRTLFDDSISNKLRGSTLQNLRELSKELGATLSW